MMHVGPGVARVLVKGKPKMKQAEKAALVRDTFNKVADELIKKNRPGAVESVLKARILLCHDDETAARFYDLLKAAE